MLGEHARRGVGQHEAFFNRQKQLAPFPPTFFGADQEWAYVEYGCAPSGLGEDGVGVAAALREQPASLQADTNQQQGDRKPNVIFSLVDAWLVDLRRCFVASVVDACVSRVR